MENLNINSTPKVDKSNESGLFANKVNELVSAALRNSGSTAVKKICGTAAAVCFGGLMAWHATLGTPNAHLSDTNLANIEALAGGETTAISKKYDCYSILDGSGQSISCNTCQLSNGKPPWYHFGSKCTSK